MGRIASLVFALLTVFGSDVARSAPAGREILVSEGLPGIHFTPRAIALANDEFIVLWANYSDSKYRIIGQRFSALDARIGGVFSVWEGAAGSDWANFSALPTTDGNFLVLWAQSANSRATVYGQFMRSTGARAGSAFKIEEDIADFEAPAAAKLTDGNLVILWATRDIQSIYGRRYTQHGSPIGSRFRVPKQNTYYRWNPSVSSLNDGGFVAVWEDVSSLYAVASIRGQRFNSSASRVGGEFSVALSANGPKVVGTRDGGFAVAYFSTNTPGSSYRVYLQRFSSDAKKVGIPVAVAAPYGQQDIQYDPSPLSFDNGDIAVAWSMMGSEFGHLFNSNGEPYGCPFQINTTNKYLHSSTSAAPLSGGDYVVAYTSADVQGYDDDVFAQRILRPFFDFPLKCTDAACSKAYTNGAYTPGMVNSILDHSLVMNKSGWLQYGKLSENPPGADGKIVGFSGEEVSGNPSPDDARCIEGTIDLQTQTSSTRLTNSTCDLEGPPYRPYTSYDEHPGYDYKAACNSSSPGDKCTSGTPVYAAADGRVVKETTQRRPCILNNLDKSCAFWGALGIEHKAGYITQYLHLSRTFVNAGDSVKRGDLIGESGNSGVPYAPHLHFEVLKKVGTKYEIVDPYGWCGFNWYGLRDPLSTTNHPLVGRLWR